MKTQKSRKGGSTGLKCGPQNVDPLGASQCDFSWKQDLWSCNDGSWLEIILELHWALNPTWDKETHRGRPLWEKDRDWSKAAKSQNTMAGWLAGTVGQESVPNRLFLRPYLRNQPRWPRGLRVLPPKLTEHLSVLLNHLVCSTLLQQSRETNTEA